MVARKTIAVRKKRRVRADAVSQPAKPPASVASLLPKPTAAQVEAARAKFAQGILTRGEAARKGQPLPPGATHEIAGTDAKGKPILKRRRFSVK